MKTEHTLNSQTPPKAKSYSFKNTSYLKGDQFIENETLTVHNNLISDQVNESETLEIDASNFIILPGLINSHTHSPMNFLRGLVHGQKNMIENIFFKMESKLTAKLVKDLSYSYIISGIKSGTTSFVDHYYFSEEIGNCLKILGMRGFIGETLADLSGAFPSNKTLTKVKKEIDNWQLGETISPIICPHAIDTVSDQYAKEISDFLKSSGLPIHFHLSQTQSEWDYCHKEYGCSPTQKALKRGWLGDRSQAVHLLHVNDDDLKILKDSGTTITTCPSSQIIYEKLAPIERFYKNQIPLTLATDCAASNDQADLLQEAKILSLLLKDRGVDDDDLYQKVFFSMTQNPSQVFDSRIGSIKNNNFADLIFIEKNIINQPIKDIWSHIIFSLSNSDVLHSMINGKWVLWNREIQFLNEKDCMEQYLKAIKELES
ncbi:MAG: amidohydrolase family protein [Bacteriovoracaceae bacterium]